MSSFAFQVFVTVVTGGLSLFLLGFDVRNLLRTRALDPSDPSVRDRRFGYSVGVVIAAIGLAGSAKFWW